MNNSAALPMLLSDLVERVRPDQWLEGLVGLVAGQFSALTNSFFTHSATGSYAVTTRAIATPEEAIVRAAESRATALAFLTEQWETYVMDVHAPNDVDAITDTVENVFEVVIQFGPSAVDLANLNAERVHGEHLAALLRATSTWRDVIPGWHRGLQIAEIALRRAGTNPRDALVGLA